MPDAAYPEGSILEEGLDHEYFARYQARRRRAVRRTAAAVLARVKRFGRPGPFLEIGCGMGDTLAHIFDGLPEGTEVAGIDIDPEMIERAQRRLAKRDGLHLAVHDARTPLPFADGHFAVVFAEHVFHHMQPHDKTIAEIRRVLAPEGIFCLLDLDRRRLLSRVFRFGYPILKSLRVSWPIAEGAYRSFERSRERADLEAAIGEAGFKLVDRAGERFNFLLTFVKPIGR